MQNNVAFSKELLRKKLRSERLAIDIAAREAAALAAASLFVASELFQTKTKFAGYIAHGGEFDVAPLFEAIWRAGKLCYLPVLSLTQAGWLQFASYDSETVLQTNKYNILEPELDSGNEILASELDVVLMPLTAFNRDGFRLGSGGGYYDRTFEFLRASQVGKPLLIGVGFAMQELAELPHDEWDVRLDGILTEKELVMF